jgi:hypothetical protein
MDIFFYVSSHGYGHAARQQPTLRLLKQAGHRVHVRSAAPAKFFRDAASHTPAHYDIGMLQHDPLRYDVAATAAWYEAFIAREDALIRQEAAAIRQQGAALVLSDMPPVACAIATAAGVPCYVLSHFLWDWVYAHYEAEEPRFTPIIAHITRQYASASGALRMPFAHPFTAFAQAQDVGLFVNTATQPPGAVRAAFGVPAHHRLALLTMGGHGWGQTDVRPLIAKRGWTFLVMPGAYEQVRAYEHFRLVPTDYEDYHNLIAAADVVVGKAGGSTVAEVIGHRSRMLYTLTSHWRESALLDAALQTHAVSARVPLDAFERGEWVDMLDALAAQPRRADAGVALDGPEAALALVEKISAGVRRR